MQQPDTAQVTPWGGEPAAADLFCAIPGMAVTLVHQHHELTELKETLWDIIQPLPHVTASATPCPASAPAAAAPQPPAASSAPRIMLPEVYHGEPETLQGFIINLSLYFVQHPASNQEKSRGKMNC